MTIHSSGQAIFSFIHITLYAGEKVDEVAKGARGTDMDEFCDRASGQATGFCGRSFIAGSLARVRA